MGEDDFPESSGWLSSFGPWPPKGRPAEDEESTGEPAGILAPRPVGRAGENFESLSGPAVPG
ncbi:MAG TPA: hypothetical protein VJ715_19485, partial [Pyrinomonadaceae bacterium]|nr:hypothetical protein [Pyrinomonadaceae bacterium]